ncbi:transposase [Psychrobacillus sp. AK 1817]|nr:transposase [Psychrobacillus sp. AK 1817]
MLTFFTDPYKDELLYSSIARYHFYSGNINLKDTLEELFRSRTVGASVLFGSRFTILAEQLGRNYSVESLLNNHTIYPYYALFISVQRQQEVISKVKGKANGLYWSLGMAAGILRRDGLYYCSLCANVDIEKYGEPHIHREHQLQGIEYCAHHETKLKKYVCELRTVSTFAYIRFDEKIMDLSVSQRIVHNEFSMVEIKLAKMAYQLFLVPFGKFSRENIVLKYRALLRGRNLMTLKNKVRKVELHRAFSIKFPKGFLDKYESSIINESPNWLNVITSNEGKNVHPFRHLLLIFFLGQDIDSFLEIKPDQGPFGPGPWPCLNKASKHFERNVVNKLFIKSDRTAQPIGEFSCSCGFIYVRTGPDKTANDKYRIRYIKVYGESWHAEIHKLHNNGLSINAIAKQLGVSKDIISRQLRGISKSKSKSKDKIKSVSKEELIKKYRKELLEVMKQIPNYSRTELSKKYKKIYSYLFKNDKVWLIGHLPKKRKIISCKTFDWKARDEDYYEKIKILHKDLLDLDKLVRITRTFIGKRLGIISSLVRSDTEIKLPRTNQLLSEIVESVQDFQYRRCIKILDEFIEEDEPFGIWKVQKKGGVHPRHFIEIKTKLEEYIERKKDENY